MLSGAHYMAGTEIWMGKINLGFPTHLTHVADSDQWREGENTMSQGTVAKSDAVNVSVEKSTGGQGSQEKEPNLGSPEKLPRRHTICSVLSRVRLYGPFVCSPPGSPVHGILQARILEWVAISFSRGSCQPRLKPVSPAFPALQADSFTAEPFEKPWTSKLHLKGQREVGLNLIQMRNLA